MDREKGNRGFTLVELIIVIAMIAALTTAAAMSAGLVASTDARTCANDMMNAIAECRIVTMGRGEGNVRLLFYRGSDGKIYSELQTREEEDAPWAVEDEGIKKFGAGRCSIGSAEGKDDLPVRPGSAIPALEDGMWEIYFDRSSGSLKDGTSISDIYISGGSKQYHIHLESLTGKAVLK